MTALRTAGDDKDEAQRFRASQAAREVAHLDAVSVYYVIIAKMEAGRMDEAKQIAAEWKKASK